MIIYNIKAIIKKININANIIIIIILTNKILNKKINIILIPKK